MPPTPHPPESPSPVAGETALRSVHTSNVPALLDRLHISLVVSTYQAGKVMLIRQAQGTLNTHFRAFAKPMGLAADAARLAIGGTHTVWEYRNMPAVAQKLEPPGTHDACYLPRRIHVTGDIDIHELTWAHDGALWLVNTRFSCLCTLDDEASFTPRWRPPFVTALAPQDRCHLNGLAMVDGRPTYATALGATDTPAGWRAHKADGGVVLEVPHHAVVLRGLSMPHSPRWYQGRLWVLESGQGRLAVVALAAGTWQPVAQLPGYTRGLDFAGPLAFVGLSQVREHAGFSDIPLVERLAKRACGVWVVHLETGQTVGFVRFEAGVQEIFAVQVLHGLRFPKDHHAVNNHHAPPEGRRRPSRRRGGTTHGGLMAQPFAPSPSETILLTPWPDPLATAMPTPGRGRESGPGGGELWRRMTTWYTQLRALPRCVRRALQRKLALPLAGAALLLALSPGLSQAATIWTVCASGCTYTSIKAAIAAPITLDGDTLAIAAGTYTEPGIIANKSLTLRGEDAETTIVQAAATPNAASSRVFTIAPGVTVTLQELTIRHGSAVSSGRYHSNEGGGLFNDGTLTLINSIVSGNAAQYGGGLVNNHDSGLTLTHSTVSSNAAEGFGGLLNYGTLTLTNSTVSSNSASGCAGGLSNGGTLTLLHSTVSSNSASVCAGGLQNYGTLTLTNSTVSGNSAPEGGGLWNDGTLTLANSTVSGNSAPEGGGLWNDGTLTLTNSLVANNPSGGDCLNAYGGSITSEGYNLDSNGSCHLTARTDRPGVDPLLGPLQDNGGPTFTQALQPGSPALDAIPWGTNGCGTSLVSDQRWQARPQAVGGHCDIGAYEVEVAGEALGGWVTGFTPQTVVCQNVTTGHAVTLSNPASPWDCEAAGLGVTSGDHVSILARGPLEQGATDVGGAVTGMQPSSAGCTNLTTGQQVTFQQMVGATAGSCVAAGLVVHPGDQVQMSVAGAAE